MPPAQERRNLQDPQKIFEALEGFLAAAKSPVLIESGKPALTIDRQRLRMEATAHGVIFESWAPEGNTVRRLTTLVSCSRIKLELQAKRFAGADIRLSLIDLAASAKAGSTLGHSSEAFLQRLISRSFPNARTSRLTGSPDLQNSLSGRHVRCLLQEGNVSWAVAAAPPCSGADVSNCTITTGLLWLHLLRQRHEQRPVVGLRLILPQGQESRTAHLLRFLDPSIASFELYAYDSSRSVWKVDLADVGNQQLELQPRLEPLPLGEPLLSWLEELESKSYVETVVQADGVRSIRVHGLEFAAIQGRRMSYGLDENVTVTGHNFNRVVELAKELAEFRNPYATNQQHRLYTAFSERWLESQLRQHMGVIEPSLSRSRIYSQSVSTQGSDRGLVDLIACDCTGRLTIIEVKESASLQLPIQALDYWAQAATLHQINPEALRAAFPEQIVSEQPPRLLLIAPSLEFHPTTELLTQYFLPTVPLERIGVNSAWRLEVHRRFHSRGASRPDRSILHV